MTRKALEEIVSTATYHTLGIVPLGEINRDFNKHLESSDPTEARKMRRKFRKLWRKFARDVKKKSSFGAVYAQQMGLGVSSPTKEHKKKRKVEVKRRVLQDVVRPTVKKISEVTK